MKKIESKYRLNRIKSIFALLISISIMAIIAVVVIREVVKLQSSAYNVFRYFTTISNIFAAYDAILTVPYALEGIFKQRYNVSKQITRLLFCGTICVTITMILALGLLWPINGNDAVTGYNFWCHIVCPIMVVVLFILVSSEKPISIGDCFSAAIPFMVYAIIYTIMVVVVGEENGGWPDLYGIKSMMPIWLAIIISPCVVFLIAFGFRAIHNFAAKRRWKKLVEEIIQRYKPEDGTDIRFMIYEMGELMGAYDGQYEMVIPIQLINILAEHYTEYQLEEMVNIFVKGALNKITYEN